MHTPTEWECINEEAGISSILNMHNKKWFTPEERVVISSSNHTRLQVKIE